MTDQDLIQHLRRSKGWPTLGNAAADRIEELTAERDALAKALERVRAEEQEACAKVAEQWTKAGEILLRAGEMTTQELNAAQAVARAILTAIRARTEKTPGG